MNTITQRVPSQSKSAFFINRNFALLWTGQSISVLGDYVFDTTLTLWIATLIARGQAWTPLAVSGVLIAAAVPMLIFGPLAGVFADRWKKRQTMLYMDALRALLVASLVLLPFFKQQLPMMGQLFIIYAIVFCVTLCAQFFQPARFSLISEIVDESQRTQASGLSQVTMNLAIIVGPALAAPLFFTLGVSWALILNALSFVASFSCILAVRTPEPVAEKDTSPTENLAFWREFREGLRFCAQNRLVLTILISAMLYALGGGLGNAIFVFFALQNLHIPASLYGTITGALGVGSICGALLAPLLATRLGSVRLFWLGMMAAGLLFLVYARLNSLFPALIIVFLIGIPLTILYTVVGPMLMHITPQHLLGRVTSILSLCQSVFTLAATLVAGLLTSTLLRTFHTNILGMMFGTYDVMVTIEGLFILLSGIYAWWKLWKVHIDG